MISLTSSLSACVTLVSSLSMSIRKSSSNGEPSLTVRFFLSFYLYAFFLAPYLMLFLDVSENPLVLDLPEDEYWDSESADAPDIDI